MFVELKQRTIGSVRGRIRRKCYDIALRNPRHFLNRNLFPRELGAHGCCEYGGVPGVSLGVPLGGPTGPDQIDVDESIETSRYTRISNKPANRNLFEILRRGNPDEMVRQSCYRRKTRNGFD